VFRHGKSCFEEWFKKIFTECKRDVVRRGKSSIESHVSVLVVQKYERDALRQTNREIFRLKKRAISTRMMPEYIVSIKCMSRVVVQVIQKNEKRHI